MRKVRDKCPDPAFEAETKLGADLLMTVESLSLRLCRSDEKNFPSR